MKTLKKMADSVGVLLSKQSVNEDERYRPIAFCVVDEVDGQNIAYNLLTGELVEITEEEKQILTSKTVSATEDTRELIERYFLVPKDHDDVQLSNELVAFLNSLQAPDKINSVTILTTMDCNARCFYCYELGRARTPMTVEVAKKAVKYISDHIFKNKKLNIVWLGGEPLYNTEIMDFFADELTALGIEFKSTIASNAYLFDEENADKAVNKWNIKRAQVTLDGTEKVYNKVKAFVNSKGENPFIKVTDNIERLLKRGIGVHIRLNLGLHNKEDLHNLVDWLTERYKDYKNWGIYCHLLFEYDEPQVSTEFRMGVVNDLIELEQHCTRNGVFVKSYLGKGVKTHHCMSDNPASIAITPTGAISKCEHYTDEELVGDVEGGITNTECLKKFETRINKPDDCKNCPLYPECFRVRMCPSCFREDCDEAEKYLKMHNFMRKLRYTYKRIKEKEKTKA